MHPKKQIQYSEPNDGTNDHAETLSSTQSIAITNPIINNHYSQPLPCSHQVEEHCNSDGCRQDCVVSVISTAILPMKKNPQILRTESRPKSRYGSFDTKCVNEASPGKKEQISDSATQGKSNPKSFNPHHNKDKVSVSPIGNSISISFSILNGHESPARMCQSPRYIPSTAAVPVAVTVTSDFASAKEKNHENEKASNDSHPDDTTTTNSNTNTTNTTDTDTQDKHSSTSAVSSLSLTMDALSESEENPRLEPEAAVKSNSRSGPVNASAAYNKSHFRPIFASPPHSTTNDIENNFKDHMTTTMNITRIQASSPAILRSLSPSQQSPNLSLSSQINSNVKSKMKQPIHKPELKLTLSAFRKPESAVRLTSAPPSKVLSNDYDLTNGGKHPSGKILGHGASSTVRLATHRLTGRRVAVKCIGKHEVLRRTMNRSRKRLRDGSASATSVSSSSPTLRATLDEYEILSSLTDGNANVNSNAHAHEPLPLPSQPSRSMHENIIHLIDLYETESEIHLVLEYCAGGELFDAIQKRQGESESDAEDHNLNRNRNRTHPQKSNLALSYRHTYSDTVPHPVPIPAYTESQVARIASQLLSALAFLHSRDIVHRDVKPENILLVSHDDDNLSVKLSDFGLARVLRHEGQGTDPNPLTPPSTGKRGGRSRAYSRVGSDYYAAPEISFGGEQGYDSAVDMYSLGVTLYILLCGHPPSSRPRCGSFVLDRDNDSSSDESNADGSASVSDDDDDDDKYGGILPLGAQIDFPIRLWRHISPSAKNLVKKMLRQNPDKRIKAADALRHDWILLHKNDTKSEMKGKEHEKNKLSITPMPIARIENPLRFSFLDDYSASTGQDMSSSQLLPVSPLSMSAVQGIQLDYLASKLYEAKGQQEGDFLLSNSELTKSSKSSKRRRGNSVDYTNDAKQAQGRGRRSAKKLKSSRSRSKNQRRRNIRMSDIRIPAPQHSLPVPVSLSMVELYNRVSSVADAATAVAASLESVNDGDNDDIVPTADEVGDGGSTCHFHENGQVHEVEVEVDDDTTDAATAACSASNNTMAPLSV